jgi:class 3 adenylate cyclase
MMRPVRRRLPSGTVAFLVTDVEGSTKLFHELGPDGYAQALDEHRRVFARPSGPTALTADEAAAARRRIARLRGSLADD